VRKEPDAVQRELLLIKVEEEQERLNSELENLSGMQQQMGLVINFLASQKKQLFLIENKL